MTCCCREIEGADDDGSLKYLIEICAGGDREGMHEGWQYDEMSALDGVLNELSCRPTRDSSLLCILEILECCNGVVHVISEFALLNFEGGRFKLERSWDIRAIDGVLSGNGTRSPSAFTSCCWEGREVDKWLIPHE